MPTSPGRATNQSISPPHTITRIKVAVASALLGLSCGCAFEQPGENGQAIPPPGHASQAALAPLPPASPDLGFTDVTRAAGIQAGHSLPGGRLTNIVDAVGSGAAFSDLDGDGWLDLVVLAGARSPDVESVVRASVQGADPEVGIRVFRNLTDGHFEEITRWTQIPPETRAVAIAIADVDGDGDRDLYLADRGPNRLFLNDGKGVFRESRRAGVEDPRFSVGAVFLDIEKDGDLDLYVTNYLEFDPEEQAYYQPEGFPGPTAYRAQSDALYENLGNGTFRDVSVASGVGGYFGRGMSLAAGDIDDDGDTDLFVANDATENFLLRNDGHGKFQEEGFQSGLALGENGEQTSAMAGDFGDVDGDGQIDLVVSDTAFGAFYRRVRPGVFMDDVMSSGIGALCAQYVSWGQNLLDYDNDGDLDLFVVNGGLHHLVGWEDLLLSNDGTGRFTESPYAGSETFLSREVGRSSIAGDYDNDGDVDLFVTTLSGSHRLLRNDTGQAGSWILIDLVGPGNRDAFGARVTLRAGERRWVLESRCPSGYLGQSDPRLHVGLGEGIDRVDSIEVLWPDGSHRILRDVPSRQILTIRQEAGL